MIEPDTVRLLRECDAGIRMGVAAIDDVLPYVNSETFRDDLISCKEEHTKLDEQIQTALSDYHDHGKKPNIMAKGMSWLKTNVRLAINESDKTIAHLMTDGCNMGVKTLNQFLNQYAAADENAKDIAKRLIKQEETLAMNARPYL